MMKEPYSDEIPAEVMTALEDLNAEVAYLQELMGLLAASASLLAPAPVTTVPEELH